LEDVGVVGLRVDRLGQVLADLVLVDVEGGDELDVADVVAAQVDVHQPGDEVVLLGVLVVVPALDEAARAVAHADDRDADLAVAAAPRAGPRVGGGAVLAAAVLAVAGHSLLLCLGGWWFLRFGRVGWPSGEGVGRAGSALPRLGDDVRDSLDRGDDAADRDDQQPDGDAAA